MPNTIECLGLVIFMRGGRAALFFSIPQKRTGCAASYTDIHILRRFNLRIIPVNGGEWGPSFSHLGGWLRGRRGLADSWVHNFFRQGQAHDCFAICTLALHQILIDLQVQPIAVRFSRVPPQFIRSRLAARLADVKMRCNW